MEVMKAKRGDTISFAGTLTDGEDAAVDLGDVGIAAALLIGGTRYPFTVAKVDGGADGAFTLTIPAATSEGLPPGVGQADVEFTYPGGAVASTETFFVNLVEDITNAA